MKKLPHPFRTRLADGIITEFLPPRKPSNRIIMIATGAPGYPDKRELMHYFSRKSFWVFVPRYRGSWESSGTFLENSPDKDFLDVLDALPRGFREVYGNKLFRVRPSETYLLGASFGGPAVLLAARDPRVTRVLALCPVIDWNKLGPEEPLEDTHRVFTQAYGMGYRGRKKYFDKLGTTSFYNPIDHTRSIPGEKVKIIQTKDDRVVLFRPAVIFSNKTGATLKPVARGGHLGSGLCMGRFERDWKQWFHPRIAS